jgi:acetyl-CoA carboxylase carboxyl transferase alpha subunit
LIKVPLGSSSTQQEIVWVSHNFGFLGGSLGCAEGEKITRAFELGIEKKLPVVVQCRSGGARMQEGTSSLMQMAKVSVAVEAANQAGIPFISVLCDPTFGGVSASYAMQADVRIAVSEVTDASKLNEARIGFAGPLVVLNTMCEANQSVYDSKCPPDFQAASFVYNAGQVDMILQVPSSTNGSSQGIIEEKVANICYLLTHKEHPMNNQTISKISDAVFGPQPANEKKAAESFNYTRSRVIDRPQTQDIIANVFNNTLVELSGDGKVGRDASLRGGLVSFHGVTCMAIATFKGHSPTEMQNSNYGMPSPHGYRTALRLMKLAEKFGLPVVTFVDTVGAWPTFECEKDGQSEAIATNLTVMAGLKVPIITLMVGEGGSGGALGICMGNTIAMLSGGYFGVISPEGAASILGRYKDDNHKATQFPKDCQALATAQCIYAHQLKDLGVVDFIIWEDVDLKNGGGSASAVSDAEEENYKNFPSLKSRIEKYIAFSLSQLCSKSSQELIEQRYKKYRSLGTFALMNEEERNATIEKAKSASSSVAKPSRVIKDNIECSLLAKHIAEDSILGNMSKYRKLSPAHLSSAIKPKPAPAVIYKPVELTNIDENSKSAKAILDKFGVKYLCSEWIPKQAKNRILLTDTTMRDAHQSLLATRVRTNDIIESSKIASNLLGDLFSLECWGGATFDVCMRFLDECPWERLRAIRQACPNICLQMLIRGANGVGYKSYPDNVVREFVHLAAVNGMDIFRIFDCFNIVENMKVSIDAVKETGKVAEVCICYTGNVLTSNIYNLQYYKALALEIKETGADILAIKDMAGLLRPLEAEPLMRVLREAVGENMPIHFHTHATSSGSLATCMEMARVGCNIIDFATASMADGTSQPSLNTFCAMMQGASNDTRINYLTLEPYDLYWAGIREQYSPFESGMKSGTARVFEHQIPGGQYSNLLVQSAGMGLTLDQWSAVLDAYRDVNLLFGDVVKVTPSSKCVGDLALYLVLKNLTTADLIDPSTQQIKPSAMNLDFPQSTVELLKGELGFPHLGFPKILEELVLKGQEKLTIRAGLVLPPVNFEENLTELRSKWDSSLTSEDGMSYLMYPVVFNDYMTRKGKKGPLLTELPTLVYLYGMIAGDIFDMYLTKEQLMNHFFSNIKNQANVGSLLSSENEKDGKFKVRVELQRITSIQQQLRTAVFLFSLLTHKDNTVLYKETQSAEVKDTGGVFVYEGPMANPSKANKEVASPMGGLVEKVFVKEGQNVEAGTILCTVSAMKMEVKVSAPSTGIIAKIHIPNPGKIFFLSFLSLSEFLILFFFFFSFLQVIVLLKVLYLLP